MPAIDDYSKDEERDDSLSTGNSFGGSAATAGSRAPTQQSASKQREQSFVPWASFQSANQEVTDRNAAKLNGQVAGDVAGAKKGLDDATTAFNVQMGANYGRAATPSGPDLHQGHSRGAVATAATGMEPKTFSGVEGGTLGALKPGATADGPKSLEESMGASSWDSLLGNTQKAQGEANMLGSETGVQSLLQRNGASPNSAFDAALINGSGQQQFGQTSKSGAGLLDNLKQQNANAQGNWASLSGDVAEAARQADQNKLLDEGKARDKAAKDAAIPGPTDDTKPAFGGPSYDDMTSGLNWDNHEDSVRSIGYAFDPVSAIQNNIEGAGTGIHGVATDYLEKKGVDGSEALGNNSSGANAKTALTQFKDKYGEDAARALWKNMDDATWKLFTSGNFNKADISAYMEKMWLEIRKKWHSDTADGRATSKESEGLTSDVQRGT